MNPEKVIKMRAKRILSKLKSYHEFDNLSPHPYAFLFQDDEIPLGVYHNSSSGDESEDVIVTSKGLYIGGNATWQYVPYRTITSVVGPDSKNADSSFYLVVNTQDRVPVELPVRGRNGRFLDLWEFLHFINRVLQDTRVE